MVHDLSPFLWRISGEFGIRWYGLSYMVGFIIAYFVIRWLADKQRVGLTPEMVGDFVTYIAFGTLIGGRLGYCLFYSPDLFQSFRSTFPYWGVFAVNEGGMASHGGMIGIAVGVFLFARKHGLSTVYLLDLCCVAGPVGVIFGRLANFVNGELVGRPVDASFPLAVKFPQDILNWPSENMAEMVNLANVVEKLGVTREAWMGMLEKYRVDSNTRQSIFDMLYRIIHEIQNGNSAVKEALAPFLTPRHPSQLYAALTEGVITFFVLFFLWRSPRRTGFITGSFIICYAVMRIFNEQFRMPDIQIGFQWLGLTRGQWLSIVMLAIGVGLTFFWSRTSGKTVVGWGKNRTVKIGRK